MPPPHHCIKIGTRTQQGGDTPLRHTKTRTTTWQGASPSLSRPNWNKNMTRRDISPLHHVKMERTWWEGATPFSSDLNWNGNTMRRYIPFSLCQNGNNMMRRGNPRDYHKYEKPMGFSLGFAGVGVQVWHLYPSKNPYTAGLMEFKAPLKTTSMRPHYDLLCLSIGHHCCCNIWKHE